MIGDNARQYPSSPQSPHDPSGIEVYNGHHTAPIPVYPPSTSSYTDTYAYHSYPKAPPAVEQQDSETPERKLCKIRISVFLIVISGLLILVTAGLALVAGLYGSKIASLEQAVPSLAGSIVTTLPDSPNDDNSNRNNTTPTTTSPARSSPSPSSGATPTGPLPAISTHIIVPNYKYVGCYVDDLERILTQGFAETGSIKMTNQACADYCGDKTKYFGTEAGQQCYCGNLIAERAIKANEWNCNVQCEGRRGRLQEICGGNFFVGVWERVG
ncbi:WSC domain-containing protein [Cercophora samala]|uniref:WSC domain-containing protein n=1 Tax=Cercophora samala TaxID=330535 RepID=A0AA39ZH70_9PEZI|nr:WSC domain-containing protein [Cercophora samala]